MHKWITANARRAAYKAAMPTKIQVSAHLVLKRLIAPPEVQITTKIAIMPFLAFMNAVCVPADTLRVLAVKLEVIVLDVRLVSTVQARGNLVLTAQPARTRTRWPNIRALPVQLGKRAPRAPSVNLIVTIVFRENIHS